MKAKELKDIISQSEEALRDGAELCEDETEILAPGWDYLRVADAEDNEILRITHDPSEPVTFTDLGKDFKVILAPAKE